MLLASVYGRADESNMLELSDVFAADSERIVLTVPQPYSNHNAGDLHVDADGLLYVTLGDGGSGGDPERLANDPTSLLGSLLRR